MNSKKSLIISAVLALLIMIAGGIQIIGGIAIPGILPILLAVMMLVFGFSNYSRYKESKKKKSREFVYYWIATFLGLFLIATGVYQIIVYFGWF